MGLLYWTSMIKEHEKLFVALVFVILLAGAFFVLHKTVGAPELPFINQASEPTVSENQESFNKSLYSLDDPASLWFIVNKQRSAPANYVPAGLRQPNVAVRASGSNEMLLRDEAATATEQLVAAAKAEGVNLMVVSGYRSYGLQQSVYAGNVAREGQAEADKTSARPGHSEHQTGLAVDLGGTNGICQLQTCFSQTPEGKWLAANAYKYGFVIRYPEGQEGIVGYTFEPWHLRYVGPELATETQKNGQTLEQFFGLPNAPSY